MSVADRLRMRADALEADARERAAALRADADELERGDDTWLSMVDAAAIADKKPRATREGLRRAGIELGGAGRSPRVRRSDLDRWIASNRRVQSAPISISDARAEARASVAMAAERAGRTA